MTVDARKNTVTISEGVPRVGCGAVIIKNGQILLAQRRREPEAGRRGLPGGKVDPYEKVAVATAREIREELGITIRRANHSLEKPLFEPHE